MHGSLPLTATETRPRLALTVAAPAAALAVAATALLLMGAYLGSDGRPVLAKVVLTTEDLTFSDRLIEVESDTVDLTLANVDAVTHTFTINALDVDLVAGPGEARSLTFDVTPGRYQFICTVPGHDAPGMRGELLVR